MFTTNDPIVKEVCEAGKLLAKQNNYDFHLYVETLRKHENESTLHKVTKEELEQKRKSDKKI